MLQMLRWVTQGLSAASKIRKLGSSASDLSNKFARQPTRIHTLGQRLLRTSSSIAAELQYERLLQTLVVAQQNVNMNLTMTYNGQTWPSNAQPRQCGGATHYTNSLAELQGGLTQAMNTRLQEQDDQAKLLDVQLAEKDGQLQASDAQSVKPGGGCGLDARFLRQNGQIEPLIAQMVKQCGPIECLNTQLAKQDTQIRSLNARLPTKSGETKCSQGHPPPVPEQQVTCVSRKRTYTC